MSPQTTRAPRRANSRHIARPRPAAPPVTITILPPNSPLISASSPIACSAPKRSDFLEGHALGLGQGHRHYDKLDRQKQRTCEEHRPDPELIAHDRKELI